MTTIVLQVAKLNLCRCCHSEGIFTNVYTPCFSLGVEEVAYSDILRECFSIELTPVTELVRDLLCTICENCIKRLRAAIVFKHQVKKCERMFRKIYLGQIINECEPIKVKVKEEILDAVEERPSAVPLAYESLSVKPPKDFDDDNDFEWPMDDSEVFDVVKPENETNEECEPNKTEFKSEVNDIDPSQNDNQLRETRNDTSDEDEVLVNVSKRKRVTKRQTKAKGRIAKKSKTNDNGETSVKETEGNDEEQIASSKVGKEKKKIKGMQGPSTLELCESKHITKVRLDSVNVYRCSTCGKEFDDPYKIRSHILKIHMRYICPRCQKSFPTENIFIMHKLSEHDVDDRFTCKSCDEAFFNSSSLRLHKLKKHIKKKYACDQCNYVSFIILYAYYINRHSLTHENVKRFECKYCKKAFRSLSTMSNHVRIHTGEKRKMCAVCGVAFVQKASLNYHMAKHHPDVDY